MTIVLNGTTGITTPAIDNDGVTTVSAGSASSPSIVPDGDTNTGIFFPAADTIAGVTGGVERWRTDLSGNLLVGTTTGVGVNARLQISFVGAGAQYGIALRQQNDNTVAVQFKAASGTEVGAIAITTSNTSFNTTSDYRLKENVQPMQNALATVAQLNPVTYNWKVDGSDGQGFIAHELQAVVPDAVTGEKDAVDAEGKPVYQGVDTSFLVATLTAAIQEQQAMIESLTQRIAALEGAAA